MKLSDLLSKFTMFCFILIVAVLIDDHYIFPWIQDSVPHFAPPIDLALLVGELLLTIKAWNHPAA